MDEVSDTNWSTLVVKRWQLLVEGLFVTIKHFGHTVGSHIILSLDEHAPLSSKVKQNLGNSLLQALTQVCHILSHIFL